MIRDSKIIRKVGGYYQNLKSCNSLILQPSFVMPSQNPQFGSVVSSNLRCAPSKEGDYGYK